MNFLDMLHIVKTTNDKEALRLMFILIKKELLIAQAILDLQLDPEDLVARAMLIQTFFDMYMKLPKDTQELVMLSMPPEEKLWLETYQKKGLDNYPFSDKIIEKYVKLSEGTLTEEHVAEGNRLIEAINKRLLELG